MLECFSSEQKLSSRVVFFLVSRKLSSRGVFFWRAENRGGLVLFFPGAENLQQQFFLLKENSQICMQIG